jgi:hypothetical protein
MKRIFLILGLVAAVSIFTGCASSDSGGSAEEQVEQSGSTPVAPHGNPLDTPDESTLSHVPGQ